MDVARASAASTTSTADTSKTTSTAKADDSKKSFSTLFAEAKDDLKKGEKLSKVDGHEYARIKGGTRDDMCVNLSGNERSGQAFDLIWRDGRQFHVYGGHGAHPPGGQGGRKAPPPAAGATRTPGGTSPQSSSPSGARAPNPPRASGASTPPGAARPP